jgi:K+-sensing histidine kinase KdpD
MNDEGEMHTIEERFPPLEGRTMFRWPRFLLESVLAIGGSLAVTGLIGFFHLYPTIPNISLVYLLLILVLVSTFGRYAAVLASVTAFLAFDYFLVPPFYTFVIARSRGMDRLVRVLSHGTPHQSTFSCNAQTHRSGTATGT